MPTSTLKKYTKDFNRQMANKHMKRCSTLLVIQKMQTKPIMRFHYTSRLTKILKRQRLGMVVFA
jgi:hypothetical protein